jgi:GH24 family phage-related lysozyme (muramidase)
MVDLPFQDPGDPLAQAPTPRISGAQIAAKGQDIANGVAALGQGVQQLANVSAEQAGRDAAMNPVVTRDASGNVVAVHPQQSFIFNAQAGAAYEHAAMAGTQAQGQAITTMALNNLRQKFDGDPQGFQNATNAFIGDLKSKYGASPLGVQMVDNATTMAAQHYNGLVNAKASSDDSDAKANVLAQIESQKNDLLQLAQQGATGTDAYKQGIAKLNGYFDAAKSNPRWGMPEQVVENSRKDATAALQGAAVVGHMDRTYASDGVLKAREELWHAAETMPDASPAQRAQIKAAGEARLSYLQGQNAVALQANQQSISALNDAKNKGVPITDDVWDKAQASAVAAGDGTSAPLVAAMRAQYRMDMAKHGAGPSQQAAIYGVNPNGGGAPGLPVPQSGDATALIKHFEGFRTNAYWDVNHYRTGYGSDTVTNPDGSTSPVTQVTQITQADADRDLSRRIGQTQSGIVGAIGQGAWQKLTPQAQAAMTSVAYNYGMLPPSVALAAQNGDPSQVADAIRRLSGHNGGVNATRRAQEAAFIDGKFTPPASANGVPYTDAQIKANPFLLSQYIQSQARDAGNQSQAALLIGAAAEKQLQNGFMPPASTLANYMQLTEGNPDHLAQREKLTAMVQGKIQSDVAMGMPPAQGQAFVNSVMQQAQGGSIHQQNIANEAQAAYQRGQAQLRDHPIEAALNRGWIAQAPRALNFDDPHDLGAAMIERSQAMTAIGAREGLRNLSAIPSSETDQWKGVMETGTTQQKLNASAALSALPEAQRQATLSAIAQTGVEGQIVAKAGQVGQYSPQVAQDLMEGQALIKSGAADKLIPADKELATAFARSFPIQDFPTPGLRASTLNSAKAYYVAQAAKSGDETGQFNAERWKDAIDKVTGGVVNIKGTWILSPVYGANEGYVRDAINRLSDADLAGATDNEGNAIPAKMLQRNEFGASGQWRLESHGDGQYRIFSGGNDPTTRTYLKGANGAAFLLDLRQQTKDAMQHPQQGVTLPAPVDERNYQPGMPQLPSLIPGKSNRPIDPVFGY